eukprot:gene5148-8754_t
MSENKSLLSGIFTSSDSSANELDLDITRDGYMEKEEPEEKNINEECTHEWRPYKKTFMICNLCEGLREATPTEKKLNKRLSQRNTK